MAGDPPIIITGSGGRKGAGTSFMLRKRKGSEAPVDMIEVHIKYKDTEGRAKKRTPRHDKEKRIRAVRVEIFDREIDLDDDIISANPVILPLTPEFSIRLTLLAPSKRQR